AAAFGFLFALMLLPPTPHAWHSWHTRHASADHHLAHHPLALEEPDDERVHLANRDTRPVGDPQPAGPIQNLGVLALLRGHRIDDRGGAVQILVADLAE